MKHILYIALAGATLLFSCSNQQTTEETATTTENTTVDTTSNKPMASVVGPTDPVCGMVKDDTWTDYNVADGDTTWFCSETCKTAYMGNPKKYSAK